MFSRIRKAIKEYRELKYLAYHDSLTGLLNRNWLYKNINQINCKYVYFIDLNNLHEINKKGHTYGDEHIRNVIGNIEHNGTLVRYAGDEFILFSNVKNDVKSNTYYSVGFSAVGNDMQKAINIADSEMLKAKVLSKGYERF